MFPVDAKYRTLIHLKKYQNYQHDLEVPYDITQAGIADNIGITRGHLTQVINKMCQEGLVIEKICHVQGNSRRRKVYFLSPSGIEQGKELNRSLKSKVVALKTSSEDIKIKLGDVGRYIDSKTPILDAIKQLDSQGVIDLTKGKTKEDIFVGRERELETLKKELMRIKKGISSTVFLSGDTGIGKTRLAMELKEYAENQGFQFLSGKAHFETSDPYLPFKRAFRKHFDHSEEFMSYFIPMGMSGTKDIKADNQRVFEMQRRMTFFETVRRLKERSEETPLILFLDDMQWSDKTSLQMLFYLTLNLEDSRILLLVAYRPEDIKDEHFLNEIKERLLREHRAKFITIKPLNKSLTREMVNNMLNIGEVPSGFIETLHEMSDGIPLFIREYLKALIDDGTIDLKTNTFPLKENEFRLPRLIQDVIKKKIDSLPPEPYKLLQLGSVIGDEIPFDLILSLSGFDELDLLDHIDVILGSEFWHEDTFGERFHFNHRSVHITAYRNVPRLKRKRLHAIVAEHIKKVYADNIERYYSDLAYHYEKSDEAEEAIFYYMEAGESAEKVYAHEDAIVMYENCLKLLENAPLEQQIHVLEHLGDVHKVLGKYDKSRNYYDRLISSSKVNKDISRHYRKIADTWLKQGEFGKTFKSIEKGLSAVEHDAVERCKLLNIKGWAKMQEGNNQDAMDVFREERRLAEDMGSSSSLGEALHNLGTLSVRIGNYKDGLNYLESAVSIRRDIGDKEGVARSLNNLGIIYEDQGHLGKSLDAYTKSLEIQKEMGMKEAIATVYVNMGIIQGILGRNQEAEKLFEKSLDMFECMGDKRGEALSLSNLGKLHIQKGLIERSLELNKKCFELSKDIGYQRAVAMSLNHMGECYHLLGDLMKAKENYEESKDMCLKMGDKRGYASAIGNIGDIYLETDKLDKSLELYNKCIEIYDKVGDLFETVNNEVRLTEVYYLKGDIPQALEHGKRALSLAEGKKNNLAKALAQRMLGRIMRSKGEYEEAYEYLTKSGELLQGLNNRPELCLTRYDLALLLIKKENYQEGLRRLKELRDGFKDMGMRLWKKRCSEHIDTCMNSL
ncbi:MAG: BREX system ATP-binding domain-containing protein [Thermoplasmata archaeon]